MQVAATLTHNLIIGARAFTGNLVGTWSGSYCSTPAMLVQDSCLTPSTAYVDLGFLDVDADNPDIAIKHRVKLNTLTARKRKLLKRAQTIESIIDYLKINHRMERCHLDGEQSERLNAVWCTADYDNRWLQRMIAKKLVSIL